VIKLVAAALSRGRRLRQYDEARSASGESDHSPGRLRSLRSRAARRPRQVRAAARLGYRQQRCCGARRRLKSRISSAKARPKYQAGFPLNSGICRGIVGRRALSSPSRQGDPCAVV
jgi:hypothetical protein